jgi:6-phosphogluconolactonase (cycloisomerase 2 family)
MEVGGIAVESINPSTGALATVSLDLTNPMGSMVIDPTGEFLYIGDPYNGQVNGFGIDASSGLLTPLPGATQYVDNALVTSVDPSGRFLYTLYPSVEAVSFSISPGTGALSGLTLEPAGAAPLVYSSTP